MPSDTPQDMQDPLDAEWVRRARLGDHAAFESIVQRYGKAIYRHMYRMMLNREDAEDLTQEAFIRAFRYVDRLDTGGSLRSWLYTIATRVGLNALRSQYRRGKAVTSSYEAHVESAGDLQAPGSGASAEHAALRDELEVALAALQPRAALLIQLHHTEGFPIREAAAIVGMSPASAKVALCRARKELRERLLKENQA
ncbi:MAG: RNA polymerase sigma factor [Candidatus Hydrogenedentes bacterium]|nr:RNA polymerase sigma factor [Candidatus Hydrogenedentota bacterium]